MNQLAGFLTVISAQGVCQVVGSFDWEPIKFRDWIKSTGKYVLLASGDDNQSKQLVYQSSRGAIIDFIQRYMAEYPKIYLGIIKIWDECEICWSKWFPSCFYHVTYWKASQTWDCTDLCREAVCFGECITHSGILINGLYHDFLHRRSWEKIQKHFRLQYSLHWLNKICERDFT